MDKKRHIVFTESMEGAQSYDLMPTYSYDTIGYLYDNLFNNEEQVIADIGSGTGRLTSQILPHNIVYGIEPDDKMRCVAEEKFKNIPYFHSIYGTAEKTNLPSKSVDFLTVGQAFHRFNIDSFREEANRILRIENNVIILWNRIHFDNPIFQDLLSSIKACYSGYHSRFICDDEIEGARLELEQNNSIVSEFFFGNYKMISFENPFELSEYDFYRLCLSLWLFPLANGHDSKKIIESNEFNILQFKKSLSEIFSNYCIGNKIILPLGTDLYFYQ